MQKPDLDDVKQEQAEQVSQARRSVFSSLGLLALGGGAVAFAACETPTADATDEISAVPKALGADITTVPGLLSVVGSGANDTRMVLGYSSVNDGGGGLFVWTTDTTTPQPTTGST